MSYLRDRVIILKKEPYREHDRRYVMYGVAHGLLSAVARGASSSTSKQVGHLEPFSRAEVMIAKGSAFDKLAVATNVGARSLMPHRSPLAAFAILGAFADVVIRLSRPGISDERVYRLLDELIETISLMPAEPSADRARLVYTTAMLKLLDALGFGPTLDVEDAAVLTMLKFMRGASFVDVLRLTAPREVLQSAAAFVEEALQETPLEHEPHGSRTIQSLLG